MDRRSFDILHQRAYNHGLKLFGTLKFTTDAEEEAKDHASEVVSRFWQTCEHQKISIQDPPLALFYTISKNRFLDWLKGQTRISAKLSKYQRERETDPERHDPRNEVTEILDKALEPLSERQFQVISLTRLGKTEKEIVAATGLTANKVKYAKRIAFKIIKRDPALAEYMHSDN